MIKATHLLTGRSADPADTPGRKPLPQHQALLLAAVVLMPLQRAFTIDVGFPFKPSEVLIMLAAGSMALAGIGIGPRTLVERLTVALLGVVTVSFAIRWLTEPPSGPWRGYPRSPQVDLTLYLFYSGLAVLFFLMLGHLDTGRFRRALHGATWVLAATTAVQWYFHRTGQTGILDLLNYQTDARALALDGSGEDVLRSGPFVEGQHLGFVASFLVILALRDRRYVTAVVALICTIYSQSTTAVLGLVAAGVVVLLLRPGVARVAKVLALAVGAYAMWSLSGALRLFTRLQLAKLGYGDAQVLGRDAGRSWQIREEKTRIGIEMLGDHFFIGVGPGRYGHFFFDYAKSPPIPEYYFRQNHRAIAENAYLHLGAENGIFALGLFLVVLVLIAVRLGQANPADLGAIACVSVGLVTQSSWTFIPIWTILAYLALAGRQEPAGSAEPKVDPDPVTGRPPVRSVLRTHPAR